MEPQFGKKLSIVVKDISDLAKEITTAREFAILGEYEKAILKFKSIFEFVFNYSKKYEGSLESKSGGYAA